MSEAGWAERRAGQQPVPAPVERGWGKLLLALAAFLLFVRFFPPLPVFVPIEQTLLLFVPALAVCMLVGWWAGGSLWPAVFWVGLAVVMAADATVAGDRFGTLVRGWSLLLAGAFGLVCLFGPQRPLLTRALLALVLVLLVTLLMGVIGPVSLAEAGGIISKELAQRAAESVSVMRATFERWSDQMQRPRPPQFEVTSEFEKDLGNAAQRVAAHFPSLLALESLCALALAWTTYHRIARTRIGPPLAPLAQFRFNDQLVWGLIVGLTIMVVPTLEGAQPLGRNLLLFFGALFALRGLGVLAWFVAPRSLVPVFVIAFILLTIPSVALVTAYALTMLFVVAFGLGLGDTWADWRSRARSTS